MLSLIIVSWLVITTYAPAKWSGSAPALIAGNSAAVFSNSDKHGSCIDAPTFDKENGWCSLVINDANSYLQVDLGAVYEVSEVATRARGLVAVVSNQWVKTYKLTYSATTAVASAFTEYGELQGNTDSTSAVSQTLSPPIVARYLRFVPTDFNVWKSMRVEAYGVPRPETDHCACSTINERIDNVIRNAETLWGNYPSAARPKARQKGRSIIPGGDFIGIEDKISQNNLIQLSLLLNVLIIIVGTCICVRAGVCASFIAGGKQAYQRVKYYEETNDEHISIVRNKNNK